ncbi:hypothetical protein STEG23_010422 [Scotinomys teguina]
MPLSTTYKFSMLYVALSTQIIINAVLIHTIEIRMKDSKNESEQERPTTTKIITLKAVLLTYLIHNVSLSSIINIWKKVNGQLQVSVIPLPTNIKGTNFNVILLT